MACPGAQSRISRVPLCMTPATKREAHSPTTMIVKWAPRLATILCLCYARHTRSVQPRTETRTRWRPSASDTHLVGQVSDTNAVGEGSSSHGEATRRERKRRRAAGRRRRMCGRKGRRTRTTTDGPKSSRCVDLGLWLCLASVATVRALPLRSRSLFRQFHA